LGAFRLEAPVIRFAPPGAECECVYAAGRGFSKLPIVVCVGNERMPESSPGSGWDRRVGPLRCPSPALCASRAGLATRPQWQAILSQPGGQASSRQVRLLRLVTA